MTELKYEDFFSDDDEPKKKRSKDSKTTTNLEIEMKLSFSNNLIDPEWEIIDPVPDVLKLFQIFDQRFFKSALGSVEVKWSKRMTVCAGLCRYQGPYGLCSISLSENLLKFRPRKDLIETLLHEMIHAYLFVTNNFRDRDDHGPKFQSHMNRINSEAGTKITIYHSFHDEVNFYKVHWWRCNGPCQNNRPFYGWVKRSMNRAPGPNDFWWKTHQATCNGTFIKVKEPEKNKKTETTPKNKETKNSQKRKSLSSNSTREITSYFDKPKSENAEKSPLKKTPRRASDVIPFSGGGIRLGGEMPSSSGSKTSNRVPCPVCAKIFDESLINDHLDKCLT